MNSEAPIEILLSDSKYPRTAPYYAGGAKGSADRKSISLTRLFSRLDYVTNNDASFTIDTYPEGENGAQGDAAPLFNISFYQAELFNIADKEFLFPKAHKDLTGVLTSPGSLSTSSQVFSLTKGTLGYIPENIPAYTSLTANNSGVTFKTATYLRFDGLLTAAASCPQSLKDAMTAHKDIWYYDDGTFQTVPRALKNGEAAPTGAYWKKLVYTTIGSGATAKSGYLVSYYAALRHNALTDAGAVGDPDAAADAANSVASLNSEDGRIRAMEYAIVRNHIYEIGINAVRSLPRPFSEEDPVENGKDALELQVKVPAAWTYHRLFTEMEVD